MHFFFSSRRRNTVCALVTGVQTCALPISDAGYGPVGFDHFARPDDSLAVAAREGRVNRNFQGFTEDDAPVLIGFGASAISKFTERIVQNEKKSGPYRDFVGEGRHAEEREIGGASGRERVGQYV